MPDPGARTHRGRLRSTLAVALRAFGKTWEPPLPDHVPLHRCERCGSDAVCPIDWSDLGSNSWEIDLRCGECAHWRTTVASDDDASAFDARLGKQTARIEAAVARLDRERMVAEAEQLAHALEHDLIDAGDFAR